MSTQKKKRQWRERKILDYIRDPFIKILELKPTGINSTLSHEFIVKITNTIILVEDKTKAVYTNLTINKKNNLIFQSFKEIEG